MRTSPVSYRVGLGICLGSFLLPMLFVFASSEFSVARTVPLLEGVAPVGTLVQYSETDDIYSISASAGNADLYGVVVERPAIVIQTATTAVPVATRGVAQVRVSGASGEITRGDVLTSSNQSGVAERATIDTDTVFAIALEGWTGSTGEGLIWAEIGAERAQLMQQQRQELREEELDESEERNFELWLRLGVAAFIAIAALGFVLYTARSIWLAGIGAIGRNPRARGAVWLTAVGSTVLVALVGVVAILVALGVLVLPV